MLRGARGCRERTENESTAPNNSIESAKNDARNSIERQTHQKRTWNIFHSLESKEKRRAGESVGGKKANGSDGCIASSYNVLIDDTRNRIHPTTNHLPP